MNAGVVNNQITFFFLENASKKVNLKDSDLFQVISRLYDKQPECRGLLWRWLFGSGPSTLEKPAKNPNVSSRCKAIQPVSWFKHRKDSLPILSPWLIPFFYRTKLLCVYFTASRITVLVNLLLFWDCYKQKVPQNLTRKLKSQVCYCCLWCLLVRSCEFCRKIGIPKWKPLNFTILEWQM